MKEKAQDRMRILSRLAPGLAVLLIGGVTASCLGSSPAVEYYTFETIEVNAGEKGIIQVRYRIPTVPGDLRAAFSFSTTDPAARLMILEFGVKTVKLFDVSPDVRFERALRFDEQRRFTAFIRSNTAPDFELLDPVSLPEFIEITLKKRVLLPDGKPSWRVEGLFGPRAKPVDYVTEIYFKTRGPDRKSGLDRLVRVGILATVEDEAKSRRKAPAKRRRDR